MKIVELRKIKKIILIIISLLEKNILNINNEEVKLTEKQSNLLNFLIGNRESVVSILSKLISLLIKINSFTNCEENNNSIELEKDDINIIIDYINKKNKDEINR